MAFGGGIFAKWLGYEDEALINGISALVRDVGIFPFFLSPTHVSIIWRRLAFLNLEVGLH